MGNEQRRPLRAGSEAGSSSTGRADSVRWSRRDRIIRFLALAPIGNGWTAIDRASGGTSESESRHDRSRCRIAGRLHSGSSTGGIRARRQGCRRRVPPVRRWAIRTRAAAPSRRQPRSELPSRPAQPAFPSYRCRSRPARAGAATPSACGRCDRAPGALARRRSTHDGSRLTACGGIASATPGALFGRGVEIDLHVGVGKHDGADVAAFHDEPAGRRICAVDRRASARTSACRATMADASSIAGVRIAAVTS